VDLAVQAHLELKHGVLGKQRALALGVALRALSERALWHVRSEKARALCERAPWGELAHELLEFLLGDELLDSHGWFLSSFF
jgi:hypothetical protein